MINNHKQLIHTSTDSIEVAPVWQSQPSDTLALICHPHPLYGGTMDNKVVTTVARHCVAQGMHTVRFNFRGVGASTGTHDHGVGEVADVENVLQWAMTQAEVTKLWLAGFSFGGFVAAKLATRLENGQIDMAVHIAKLTLIAPAVAPVDDRVYDVSDLVLPKHTHVIYGSADEVVAPAAIAQFAKDYQLTQTILANASHFFHGRLTDLKQFL